jgi:hypothetical protein
MKTKIYSLIYLSTAVRPFSKVDLLALLMQSRQNNASLDITGILLYKAGTFQQILEGPEGAVKKVFEKVRLDPRHRGVIKFFESIEDERLFPDWSMGFGDLNSAEAAAVPGYSTFLNTPLADEQFIANPGTALNLMLLFKKNMSY